MGMGQRKTRLGTDVRSTVLGLAARLGGSQVVLLRVGPATTIRLIIPRLLPVGHEFGLRLDGLDRGGHSVHAILGVMLLLLVQLRWTGRGDWMVIWGCGRAREYGVVGDMAGGGI